MSYLFLKKRKKREKNVFLLLSRTNVGLMALQSLQPRFSTPKKNIIIKKFIKKKLIMSYFLIVLNPYVMPLSLHYFFFFLQSFDLFIVSTCEIFLQT